LPPSVLHKQGEAQGSHGTTCRHCPNRLGRLMATGIHGTSMPKEGYDELYEEKGRAYAILKRNAGIV